MTVRCRMNSSCDPGRQLPGARQDALDRGGDVLDLASRCRRGTLPVDLPQEPVQRLVEVLRVDVRTKVDRTVPVGATRAPIP